MYCIMQYISCSCKTLLIMINILLIFPLLLHKKCRINVQALSMMIGILDGSSWCSEFLPWYYLTLKPILDVILEPLILTDSICNQNFFLGIT